MFSHGLKRASVVVVTLALTLLPLTFIEKKEVQAKETAVRQRVYRRRKRKTTTRIPPRKTGGLRGGKCNSFSPEIITLIAPEDHIGTTVLARPRVLWFSKQEINQPVRITFYSPGEKPILVENFEGLPQGFITFKIPEDNPGMEIGKLYRWTVTIVCNEKRPSKNLYTQGLIERVPEFAESSRSYPNCAVDFARLGIWYDAIACSYSQVNLQESYTAFHEEDFNALLEQVNLSEFKIKGTGFQNAVQNPESE